MCETLVLDLMVLQYCEGAFHYVSIFIQCSSTKGYASFDAIRVISLILIFSPGSCFPGPLPGFHPTSLRPFYRFFKFKSTL